MTVRDLIEALEELPYDYPVVVNSCEVDTIVEREEIYYSTDNGYQEGPVIKIL